jgi:endonuclease YncB( thermonuclease family)
MKYVALALLLASPAVAHDRAIVQRIIDCDTLVVAFDRLPDEKREIVVRVRGISAPESHHPKYRAEWPLGRACTSHLKEILPNGSPVWLVPPYEASVGGRWGVGVQMSVDQRDLATELIREGWALPWNNWKKDPRPMFDSNAPYPIEKSPATVDYPYGRDRQY